MAYLIAQSAAHKPYWNTGLPNLGHQSSDTGLVSDRDTTMRAWMGIHIRKI